MKAGAEEAAVSMLEKSPVGRAASVRGVEERSQAVMKTRLTAEILSSRCS
jgi:hypothetical protein